MVTETPNLKLKKPASTDFVDINVLNENMDILDRVVGEGGVSTIRITFENSSYLNQTYEVKDSKGLTKYSGALKTYETDLLVGYDTYHLYFSSGIDFNIKIDSPGVKNVKIEDYVAIIQIDDSQVPTGTTFKANGTPFSGKSIVVSPGQYTISSVSPRIPNPNVAIAQIADITVNAQMGKTVIVKPVGIGILIEITNSQSAELHGQYMAFVMGAGGGGASDPNNKFGSGGGGGYFKTGEITLDSTVSLTIGTGGAGGVNGGVGGNGGATSIGNLLSAQGGGGGYYRHGGDGGSGGGGGRYDDPYSMIGYSGGNGEYGGGGGGGGGYRGSSGNGGNSVYGNGGDGGGCSGGTPGIGGKSTYGAKGLDGTRSDDNPGLGGAGSQTDGCSFFGLTPAGKRDRGSGSPRVGGIGGSAFAFGGDNFVTGGTGGGGYGEGGGGSKGSSGSYYSTPAGLGAGGVGSYSSSKVATKGGNGVILLKWVRN